MRKLLSILNAVLKHRTPWRSPAYLSTGHPRQLLLLALIQPSAWKGNSANFAVTEFSEVQPRCLGMGGAPTLFLLRLARCFGHPTSNHSAASLSSMSSLSRASMYLCRRPCRPFARPPRALG